MSDCMCLTPPFDAADFESRWIGVDETNGRFGEVSVERCRRCGREWLRYFVEYEGFSGSGRWYRGLAPEEVAREVTAETAVGILEGLDWYFYGGSYFGTSGKKGAGPIVVGL